MAVVETSRTDVDAVEDLLAAGEEMVETMAHLDEVMVAAMDLHLNPNTTKPDESVCHRCGMSNHWAKTCRTPKHLVDLYQESLKGKNPETI